jgi:two-component system OmpR family response regulator
MPVIVLTARGEIEDACAGSKRAPSTTWSSRSRWPSSRAPARPTESAAHASASTMSVEDIEVDLLTRKVKRDGIEVALSTTEFELLVYYAATTGRWSARADTGQRVGIRTRPGTNVVDVYVGYLRRKLAARAIPPRSRRSARSATAWAARADSARQCAGWLNASRRAGCAGGWRRGSRS